MNMDAVGKKIGPLKKEYTWKDPVLYALGVGSGFSELEYCYEKALKVLPSFSIAAIFEFLSHVAITSEVNLAGILHGEQELTFHHAIPPEGTLITEGRITHYYDKGKDKGALIVAESETRHSNGKRLFDGVFTLFGRLDGGFGGENSPKKEIRFPDREPDAVVVDHPAADQPLLYRMSGDIFQLHVDPEFARAVGFERPIMHGLCTHGYACRALIKSLTPGLPEKVRRFDCRFAKPLYPGVSIETRIWKTAEGEAMWRTVNGETGETVIDNGFFAYGEVPEDTIRFDGRVAVVTGAGAGLGRAYALELARRGARVVVNDLGGARDGSDDGSRSPADRVVGEIEALGGRAVASYESVATASGGERIVQTALDAFGTVDILINNAGILRDKSFLKMTPETWQTVIDVHLHGAYNVTRPAFRVMRDKNYGRIVLTTSAAGLHGNFGQANYSAAKLALVGLMNTLRLEGEKYGVKVNTVAPVAASRLTEDVIPEDYLEKMKPERVAPMVIYLCSERCPASGGIYNAGMGAFSRSAVVTGPGAVLENGEKIPAPEAVMAKLDTISAMDGAKPYGQLNEAVGEIMAAFRTGSASPTGKSTAGGFMRAADVFEALPDAFVAEAAGGVDAIFQYDISGEDGGSWFCSVRDSKCTVEEGSHAKPTCTLKMGTADFLEMMGGALPPMQAYTSGRLTITGDVMKSQLIQKLFKIG